jgi:Raf kinase inhibitor-like YbhB/YbcL family protein
MGRRPAGYPISMKMTSPTIPDGGAIPVRFTCDGENISPELHWTELPKSTTSLALICEDPDAPSGMFVHWVMWGLHASKGGLGEGEVPAGAHLGRNNFGNVRFDGPCPPPGDAPHHYHFMLYALDREIDVADEVSARELRSAMEDATLDVAELTGTFSRP